MFLKMCLRFTVLNTCVLLLSSGIWAQGLISVPADLSSNFDPSSISLQVNYAGKAEFGFTDGTEFSAQGSSNDPNHTPRITNKNIDTSKAPIFALGDASGVNTVISFLVMMLDTTTENRVLHFLQPDFKTNGDETGISSSSQPAFSYQGPGTLGETGTRQYSFLLYQQIGTFQAKSIPSAGQTINVEQFQSDNGLEDADAGVVMVVDIAADSTTAAQPNTIVTTATAVVASAASIIATTISSPSSQLISFTTTTTTTTTTTIAPTSIPSATLPISFQSTPSLSLVTTFSSEAAPSTSLTNALPPATAPSSSSSNPISLQFPTSKTSGTSSTTATSLSVATATPNNGNSYLASRGSLGVPVALSFSFFLTIYYV